MYIYIIILYYILLYFFYKVRKQNIKIELKGNYIYIYTLL